jgi:hypothetical protein
MTTEEHARHRLHGRLEDVLGSDEASTLMGYLPPVGWADVATKHDFDTLRRDLDLVRIDLREFRSDVRSEMGQIRTDVRDLRSDSATHLRTFMLTTAGSVLTTASLAFAAARFG